AAAAASSPDRAVCVTDLSPAFDHENPAHGSPTDSANLHRLCRIHHRMKTAGLIDPDRDPDTGITRWRIAGTLEREVARNTDLITRELSEKLEHAWEQYHGDLEIEALTTQGIFDESPAEIADREESYRWGMHLLEYYSDPEYDEGDDPGPPPLAPLPQHAPPPF